MLHAHTFKHLAVETLDHRWGFYRQVRAAKILLLTTVIQKHFVWGKCPHSMQLEIFLFRSHQVKASPAMSCVLFQLEAIQNWMWVSVATCSSPPACLTCQPRQLSPISWQMGWHCGPKANFFRRNNLLMLASNAHNFKTRTSFFKNFWGKNLGICWTFSCSFTVEISFFQTLPFSTLSTLSRDFSPNF